MYPNTKYFCINHSVNIQFLKWIQIQCCDFVQIVNTNIKKNSKLIRGRFLLLRNFSNIKDFKMSLDLSGFQNPKMAIIRLLKSQCLCVNGQPCNEKKHQLLKREEESIALIKYKEELQAKATLQRAKLRQIPCVLTLCEQIQEVKQLIAGLTRQNRDRIEHVKRLQKQGQMQKYEYYQNSYEEQADLIQHQKLQAQYANMLRTLETTNDQNQRLVRKLANQ